LLLFFKKEVFFFEKKNQETLANSLEQLLSALPLVVDLDGTLVRTDTLVEAALRLAARNPWALLALLPTLLSCGKAAFKLGVNTAQRLDPDTLVYNQDVLALADSARADGRPVYLCTAADAGVAGPIAAHVGGFAGVFASDGVLNLKGPAKASFLVELFGRHGFDYVGDAASDLPVWHEAATAYVVEPARSLKLRAQAASTRMEVLGERRALPASLRVWSRALRVHQWAKNVLVFVPLAAAHSLRADKALEAAAGFVAFSLCASSVYLLNDLLDLPHDRLHPTKRRRPFASGTLDLNKAPPLIVACLAAAFLIALALPWHFLAILGVYYVSTLAYSLGLKRLPVWDVMMLAGLYTLRIFAGGAATAIRLSPWLLAFSMFLFFSLAVVKRQTELGQHVREGRTEKIGGRGYLPEDLDMLRSMAASSGIMAVLVLALYVNSPDITQLYHRPAALWAVCPILLFWVSRVLMLSNRGLMPDDPVVFALRDRVSLMVGAVALAAFVLGAL
jgi:4-hydroxybenzoate polyprenyltransferase